MEAVVWVSSMAINQGYPYMWWHGDLIVLTTLSNSHPVQFFLFMMTPSETCLAVTFLKNVSMEFCFMTNLASSKHDVRKSSLFMFHVPEREMSGNLRYRFGNVILCSWLLMFLNHIPHQENIYHHLSILCLNFKKMVKILKMMVQFVFVGSLDIYRYLMISLDHVNPVLFLPRCLHGFFHCRGASLCMGGEMPKFNGVGCLGHWMTMTLNYDYRFVLTQYTYMYIYTCISKYLYIYMYCVCIFIYTLREWIYIYIYITSW